MTLNIFVFDLLYSLKSQKAKGEKEKKKKEKHN